MAFQQAKLAFSQTIYISRPKNKLLEALIKMNRRETVNQAVSPVTHK